jgi:hypothetical protein
MEKKPGNLVRWFPGSSDGDLRDLAIESVRGIVGTDGGAGVFSDAEGVGGFRGNESRGAAAGGFCAIEQEGHGAVGVEGRGERE